MEFPAPTGNSAQHNPVNQHACLFYNDDSSRAAGLQPFFEEALLLRAKIIYAGAADAFQWLRKVFRPTDLDVDALHAIGQLEFIPCPALYDPSWRADQPPYLVGSIEQRISILAQRSAQHSYRALFLCLDMHPGGPVLLDFEADLNRALSHPSSPFPVALNVLCQHNRQTGRYAELLDALLSHPMVASPHGIYPNPNYIEPPASPAESILKKRFDDWLASAVEQQETQDFLGYSEQLYQTIIQASPDAVVLISRGGMVRFASESALKLFGLADVEQARNKEIYDFLLPAEHARARENFAAMMNGSHRNPSKPYTMHSHGGRTFIGEVTAQPLLSKSGRSEALVVIIRDITDKLHMQTELEASEKRYRIISDMVSDYALCFRILPGGRVVLAWSTDAFRAITGYMPQEVLAQGGMIAITHPEDKEFVSYQRDRMMEGITVTSEFRIIHRDGSLRWVHQVSRPLQDPSTGQVNEFYLAGRDVTARKRFEEALGESERTARALLDSSPSISLLLNRSGKILASNEALVRRFNKPTSELIGQPVDRFFLPGMAGALRKRIETVIETQQPLHLIDEPDDGRTFDTMIYPILDSQGSVTRIAVTVNDVTAFRQAEKIERSQRLFAETLRETSEALSRTLHQDEVFDALLKNLLVLIPEVAVNVMLVDDQDMVHSVRYYDPRRSQASLQDAISLTLNLKTTPNLAEMSASLAPCIIADTTLDRLWVVHPANQWVRSQVAAPIPSDGRAIGFICLESDQPGVFNDSHAELLRHFAGQASISLQKARMFAQLQESHDALAAAYDATIEGWAHALELRDKETEGHSRRVVHLTLRLAVRMGVTGADLNAVRWGALLHDIGKMGVPDIILLKPGPLTEAEWDIMRQHPMFAYDMLADIPYLRRSLDIPLYHHERYNGTGYPGGLVGEKIPLAARIFTVIDALDALLIHRPYRPAWPIPEVIDHLRAEAGFQFDPLVVDMLMKMLNEEPDLLESLYCSPAQAD